MTNSYRTIIVTKRNAKCPDCGFALFRTTERVRCAVKEWPQGLGCVIEQQPTPAQQQQGNAGAARTPDAYGYTCNFGKGYTVEITSCAQEWTDHAAQILKSHDANIARIAELEALVNWACDCASVNKLIPQSFIVNARAKVTR